MTCEYPHCMCTLAFSPVHGPCSSCPRTGKNVYPQLPEFLRIAPELRHAAWETKLVKKKPPVKLPLPRVKREPLPRVMR